jgi:hypothetical protein
MCLWLMLLMMMCAIPTRGYRGSQSFLFGMNRPSCLVANVWAHPHLTSTSHRPFRLRHSLESWRTEPPSDDAKFSYSDDCFGLIALSTGIAGKDTVFALVFVALSALAALASATVLADRLSVREERRVPATVAGASLLLAPVAKQLVVGFDGTLGEQDAVSSWTPFLEVGVCAFSLLYGFVLAQRPPARTDK